MGVSETRHYLRRTTLGAFTPNQGTQHASHYRSALTTTATVEQPSRFLRFHVSSEHGVYPRLIALLLSQPCKQIGVQSYCHRLLRLRQHNLRFFPKFDVRWPSFWISRDGAPDFFVSQRSKPLPIRSTTSRCFSHTLLFHGVRPSMPK